MLLNKGKGKDFLLSFLFFTCNLRTDKEHISGNNLLSEVYKELKSDPSRFPRKTETRISGYSIGGAGSWDSRGRQRIWGGRRGDKTEDFIFKTRADVLG